MGASVESLSSLGTSSATRRRASEPVARERRGGESDGRCRDRQRRRAKCEGRLRRERAGGGVDNPEQGPCREVGGERDRQLRGKPGVDRRLEDPCAGSPATSRSISSCAQKASGGSSAN